MALNDSADLILELVPSQNHHDFVDRLVKHSQKISKKNSLAALALRCKFASRSFLRDVALGKKRLSSVSVAKISKGFQLNKPLEELLSLLVEFDLASSASEKQVLQRKLTRLKNRLAPASQKKSAMDPGEFAINWRYVYAALGTVESGATLKDIRQRTGLPASEVEALLRFLMRYKLVIQKDDRYYGETSHLIFTQFPEDHRSLGQFYAHSLKQLQARSAQDFFSKRDLHFASAISISEKHLPEVRKKIHEAALKIVDEIESGEGELVKTLLVGFF